MILGLDISTSITGATVLDKEGNIVYIYRAKLTVISKRILVSKNSIYFIQVQWYCVVDVL